MRHPRIRLHRRDGSVHTPELCPGSESCYTLFTTADVWLADKIVWFEHTGIRVELPRGFIAIVQPHHFALTRGLFVSQAHPITSDNSGDEVRVMVTTLIGTLRGVERKLMDAHTPLANLQIVRAPDCLARVFVDGVDIEV